MIRFPFSIMSHKNRKSRSFHASKVLRKSKVVAFKRTREKLDFTHCFSAQDYDYGFKIPAHFPVISIFVVSITGGFAITNRSCKAAGDAQVGNVRASCVKRK